MSRWTNAIVLVAALALVACASGRELLRVRAESHGDVVLATNGNATVIIANGRGLLEATTATEPFGPIQPPLDWDGRYVRVIRNDPPYSETFAVDEPLPLEAMAIVRAVLTSEQAAAAGLRPAIAP